MKAPGDVGVVLPGNGPASRRLVVQLRPSAVSSAVGRGNNRNQK
jgi:hypothetical protein